MTAEQYRKKPVVVDVMQVTDEAINEATITEWAAGAVRFGGRTRIGDKTISAHLLIDTLEGTMRADLGDYIIRGVQGEFYPCKPDIFEVTYEPVPTLPNVRPEEER